MRVLSLVCFALVLLLQLSSAATSDVQTVSGVVIDEGGAPLRGATVTLTTLQGAKRSTTTDAAGRFQFTDVPLGPISVAVELAGFTASTRRMHVERGTPTPLKVVLSVASPHADRSANQVVAQAPPPVAAPSAIAGGVPGGVVGGVVGGLPASPMSSYRGRSAPWNTEAYDRIEDNAFRRGIDHPLSTFSIDVDTASYSNVRRFLNGGALPPPDAVRSEELINYFKFDYPGPAPAAPFSVTTEVAACPWNAKHKLALIGLQTPRVENGAVPPRNLVFLLDVSGSMNSRDKLPLVKAALRLLVGELRPDDRVAIVVYAGASGLALPSTPATDKAAILSAIESLQPGGSTHASAGIRLAYDTATAGFIKGGVNRVILATDGDFNVGVTSEGELIRLIEDKARSGVFLTALGFGQGNLKDATLEKLADHGNGHYAYVDSLTEARKVLVEQAGGTLVTIAKDVKLQVEFNPRKVQAFRLVGYENRVLAHQDFNDDSRDAGDIGAGHTITALYEVVPPGVDIAAPGVDPLKYQRPSRPGAASDSGDLLTLKLRYKQPDGERSEVMEVPLADEGEPFEAASADFRFAAAVAAFGMTLRDSPHKGGADLGQVIAWAKASLGEETGSLRAEFITLVKKARSLTP